MTTPEGSGRDPRTFKCEHESTSNSRNLVVCIDGTSNQFGIKNTNIVELYSHITKNDQQLTYYSSGLGTIAKVTGASLRHRLSNELDMAIGRNLHKVIMACYRWLSDNYQDGDRIFLFGYSRGAYQVRALAGMIARVGLLLPGNNEQIPFAFELYSKTSDDDTSTERPASFISQPAMKESKQKVKYAELARTFQRTFCRSNIRIHFVGVWDTVSSVGFGRTRTLPCTTSTCDHICYFRHALALDERRVKFLPEYAYGGRSSCSGDRRIKEVWFAGCHADVGGGNRCNERLQSGDIPLLWMRSQAIDAGLKMEPVDVMWKIDDLNKGITRSLKLGWWFLELLPLKRLLYYNSNRQTSRPHLGGPRRILPGQKVHVSVLFKNNYRPFAQFYNNPEGWPEPMFWNDPASHRRLQGLTNDLWDKDIFDEGSVRTILDDLKRGGPTMDALDRLAFMASFDVCKHAINDYDGAEKILAGFLKSQKRLIRLSTAATYCELGWDLPLETTNGELKRAQQVKVDVSELLQSDSDRRRACMYIPSLCKRPELREELIGDEILKMLVQFCDNTRVVKHEEGTSTVAFHSTQALAMLIKLDTKIAERLIDIEAVTDITEALRSNCIPVLVSALSVVEGLTKHESALATMKVGPIVATLLKLVGQYDDFVAPAAIRVLCSLLSDDDLRETMLEFDVLTVLLDMLDRCSEKPKQSTCDALTKFAKYEIFQQALSRGGYLQRLAMQVQSHDAGKRDGAIAALVTLGSTQVGAAVTDAIRRANTIRVLVSRLGKRPTAHSAASALAQLVEIVDVAKMVSNDESALEGILNMLRRRWFDGLRGEDGLQVLSQLLDCGQLQSAVLKAGAINALRDMIQDHESAYAGLHYLRILARFDHGGGVLSTSDMSSLVLPVVNTLHIPYRRVQRIAIEILRSLSEEEEVRPQIVDGLLNLLKDRHANVLLAASTVLGYLAVDKSMRDRALNEKAVWDLSDEYYNGLELAYDEEGRGPRTSEVYESVGRMIRLMQAHHDESPSTNDDKEVEEIENNWPPQYVQYELKKENRPGAYWIATLVCCPALLLCGVGRQVGRELWQEG